MTTRLSDSFLKIPIAHRGLHDRNAGVIENSLVAFQAAIDAGYGIELDVQPAADATPMVFHDYLLDRLTREVGPITSRSAEDLRAIPLSGGDGEIPTLTDVLDLVAGQVPLLVEIKDQDMSLGQNVGMLEARVAEELASYRGPLAVMSFNPHSVVAFANRAPDVPIGLVTDSFDEADWSHVPDSRRTELRQLTPPEGADLDFVSHRVGDLASPHVSRLKNQGMPVLCWTVRSADAERTARGVADNITFEGYRPGFP